MNEADKLIKLKEKAEAYFKKVWPKKSEDVSDFGAYCIEQWLTGRNTKTSFRYLGIDYLRSFAHRTGARGSSDMLSRPPGLRNDPKACDVEQFGSDSAELRRFNESHTLRDRRLSERQRLVLILTYEWGFNLKEIGDLLAVSESRASQLLDQAMSVQKSRIQAADASEEEIARQRVKQKAVSRQIQNQLRMDGKAQKILEKIRRQNGVGMGESQEQKIWKSEQESLGAFAVNTF